MKGILFTSDTDEDFPILLYVLDYSGKQGVKQTLKLTHHAPELLTSQGAGYTECSIFSRKALE